MECARLSLSAEDKVYRIRRIRFANELPFLLEQASLPSSLFPGLEEKTGVPQRIVGLAQQYGILLGKAEERITIATASPEVAEALGVASGSPVAALDRVARAIDGRPVEWRMAWCDLARNCYVALIR
jgi:GntR family transcriptional regulator